MSLNVFVPLGSSINHVDHFPHNFAVIGNWMLSNVSKETCTNAYFLGITYSKNCKNREIFVIFYFYILVGRFGFTRDSTQSKRVATTLLWCEKIHGIDFWLREKCRSIHMSLYTFMAIMHRLLLEGGTFCNLYLEWNVIIGFLAFS